MIHVEWRILNSLGQASPVGQALAPERLLSWEDLEAVDAKCVVRMEALMLGYRPDLGPQQFLETIAQAGFCALDLPARSV